MTVGVNGYALLKDKISSPIIKSMNTDPAICPGNLEATRGGNSGMCGLSLAASAASSRFKSLAARATKQIAKIPAVAIHGNSAVQTFL